jgi:hypothetical protein
LITVDKHEGLSVRVAILNEEISAQEVDFYLFVPGELKFGKHVLNEDEFYHRVLSNSRTYFTSRYHLPLVHSRLASREKLPTEQYRVSLSLYAYQYALSLEKATHDFFESVSGLEDEEALEQLEDTIEMAVEILRRLRRYQPQDTKLVKYYNNIDNYLSWLTEQRFLSLLAHMPRGSVYKTIRQQLVELCEAEEAHRLVNRYNSDKAIGDPTRMVNKMRLLRRLIEFPVTIRQKPEALGKNLNKLAKASATAFVMLFVTTVIVQARQYLGEITLSFVLAMAGIYALREIFKDDLRDALWRWIRKGRPKWRKRFIDPTSNRQIGRQLEWLDYIDFTALPDEVKKLRRGKLRQQEEAVVRLKVKTQLETTRFLSGYDTTRDVWKLDFRSFSRLMDRGSQRLYRLNDGQVLKDSVEKRHQFNLVSCQKIKDQPTVYQRWKITVNRSKVVDIEEILD